MKKVILIEDRISRQEVFIQNSSIDLNSFDNLKNISGGTEFLELRKSLDEGNALLFNDFDVIIIHRSAIDHKSRGILVEFCRKNKKGLVLFSGGISSTIYSEIDGFPLLSLNSKDLYSNNLSMFLNQAKANEINLLILAFGIKWELNLILNLNVNLCKLINDPELIKRTPNMILKKKLVILPILNDILIKNNCTLDWLNDAFVDNPNLKINELKQDLEILIENKIIYK